MVLRFIKNQFCFSKRERKNLCNGQIVLKNLSTWTELRTTAAQNLDYQHFSSLQNCWEILHPSVTAISSYRHEMFLAKIIGVQKIKWLLLRWDVLIYKDTETGWLTRKRYSHACSTPRQWHPLEAEMGCVRENCDLVLIQWEKPKKLQRPGKSVTNMFQKDKE